jgi:hypothetical protein
MEEKVPTTVEELSHRSQDYSWGLAYVGGVAYTLINSTKIPVFERILLKMEVIKEHSNCFKGPLQGKFVCLSFASLAQHYIYEEPGLSDRHGNARVFLSPNSFASFSCGIMMSKQAVFRANLQLGVEAITSMGFASKWEEWDFLNVLMARNKHLLQSSNNQSNYLDAKSNDLLTLKHLHGAVVMYCGGFILTCFLFLLEIIVKFLLEIIVKRQK